MDCLRDARFLSDRSTAFVLSRDGPPGRYCYVDNLGVVGPRRAEIEKGLEASTRVFDGKGLLLHDRELLDDGGVSLGVHLDGKALQSRPDTDRWLRCRSALSFVISRRRCSGGQLEILLVHLTFLGLSRREVLCVFYRTYRFIQWS